MVVIKLEKSADPKYGDVSKAKGFQCKFEWVEAVVEWERSLQKVRTIPPSYTSFTLYRVFQHALSLLTIVDSNRNQNVKYIRTPPCNA